MKTSQLGDKFNHAKNNCNPMGRASRVTLKASSIK